MQQPVSLVVFISSIVPDAQLYVAILVLGLGGLVVDGLRCGVAMNAFRTFLATATGVDCGRRNLPALASASPSEVLVRTQSGNTRCIVTPDEVGCETYAASGFLEGKNFPDAFGNHTANIARVTPTGAFEWRSATSQVRFPKRHRDVLRTDLPISGVDGRIGH